MRMRIAAIRTAVTWTVWTGALAFGLSSCSGIEPVATYVPVTDPAQLYMGLTLNHAAVTLSTVAPHNTLQLTATPRNASGAPMGDLPMPIFSSSDTAAVKVTADGVLTAYSVANGVKVVAELMVDGVRHADTARVNVTNTATPPALTSMALQPVPIGTIWPMLSGTEGVGPGYVALLALVFAGQLPEEDRKVMASGLDAAESVIPNLVFEYTSLDPSIVRVDRWTGTALVLQPGAARVVARATAYGDAATDTLTVTTTLPLEAGVTVRSGTDGQGIVEPREIRISQDGIVVWFNNIHAPANLTFDAPANVAVPSDDVCFGLEFIVLLGYYPMAPGPYCGAGDVALAAVSANDLPTVQVRQFPVPGTYSYQTADGGVGRVVVVAESGAAAAVQGRAAAAP